MAEKPTILLVGPTPPPHHGVSMAMQALLTSSIAETFRLVHLDITDRRGIGHVDQPDLHDVFLFIKQFFRNLMLIFRERPTLFYLPISQTRLGFLRDSLFILPALLVRIPVIVHLHGANFDTMYAESGLLWRAYMGAILKRVSRFIVLGEMLRPLFSRWAPPDRISVVPNGIVEGKERERSDMKRGAKSDRSFRVVCLSTLSRQKGLFNLLNAIPLILCEYKEVGFVIAGPWWNQETAREAKAWVEKKGLEDKVQFIGEITGEEKRAFLRSGDLFVFPGLQQEGQPLTVLEAMCEGLPVIATDRGCLRETVVEGLTGFLIPPNSPEAIAKKVVELIGNSDLRDKMAASARERYEANYTLGKFTERMELLFNEILNQRMDRVRLVGGSEKYCEPVGKH